MFTIGMNHCLYYCWVSMKTFLEVHTQALEGKSSSCGDQDSVTQTGLVEQWILGISCSIQMISIFLPISLLWKWNYAESVRLTDSGQFSHSVVSDSLQLQGLQHTRPPCPSPTPRVYPNSCPLSRWCHPTISLTDQATVSSNSIYIKPYNWLTKTGE